MHCQTKCPLISGNSLLSSIVDAIIDRSPSCPSSKFSTDSLHALSLRFAADLRSHPRDKSLVLLLSKLLLYVRKCGGGEGTSLATVDAKELEAAMSLNRTPLKRGVVTTLKTIIAGDR